MASKYLMCAAVCTLALTTPARPEDAPGARLEQLWTKLDALWKEREDLAWQRWQALSDLEKARIIVKHRRQGGPTKQELAALTEEKAPGILAEFSKKGTDGERQLRGFASYTIGSPEDAAYEERRKAIVGEIAALGGTMVAVLLDEIVKAGKHEVEAQEALSQMGGEAVPALIKAFEKQQNETVRAVVMEALGGAEDPRARDALLRGLKDRSGEVRRAAVNGLRGLDSVPQGVFIQCLKDDYDWVRHGAIAALSEIGDTKAVPSLLKVARTDPARGKGPYFWLRKAACEALKKIAERTGAKIELPPEEVLRR
jgi:hypothetical protein